MEEEELGNLEVGCSLCEHSNVGLVSIQYYHKAGRLVYTVGCTSRVPLITILGNWCKHSNWLLSILFFDGHPGCGIRTADGHIADKIIVVHCCTPSLC